MRTQVNSERAIFSAEIKSSEKRSKRKKIKVEFMENRTETVGRIVGRRVPYDCRGDRHDLDIDIRLAEARERGAGGKAVGSPWRPAIDHKDYAEATWPSRSRFNFWIAECTGENCNAMDAKHMKELMRLHKEIMEIKIDVNDARKLSTWEDLTDEQWDTFNGTWSFQEERDSNRHVISKRKCQGFGPFCGMSSPLEVFRSDEAVVKDLTDAESLEAFNFWETQEQSCPVTIARSVSPCYESYCQSYKSSAERTQCGTPRPVTAT